MTLDIDQKADALDAVIANGEASAAAEGVTYHLSFFACPGFAAALCCTKCQRVSGKPLHNSSGEIFCDQCVSKYNMSDTVSPTSSAVSRMVGNLRVICLNNKPPTAKTMALQETDTDTGTDTEGQGQGQGHGQTHKQKTNNNHNESNRNHNGNDNNNNSNTDVASSSILSCKWEGRLRDWSEHNKTCHVRPMQCPYKKYGCKTDAVCYAQLQIHLAENKPSHSELAFQFILKENTELKQRFVAHDANMVTVEQSMAKLKQRNSLQNSEIQALKQNVLRLDAEKQEILAETKQVIENAVNAKQIEIGIYTTNRNITGGFVSWNVTKLISPPANRSSRRMFRFINPKLCQQFQFLKAGLYKIHYRVEKSHPNQNAEHAMYVNGERTVSTRGRSLQQILYLKVNHTLKFDATNSYSKISNFKCYELTIERLGY